MLNLKEDQQLMKKLNSNNHENESGHNKNVKNFNLKTFVSGGKLNLFCFN